MLSASAIARVETPKEEDPDPDFFRRPPYRDDRSLKSIHFHEKLLRLTRHHYEHCIDYGNILIGLDIDPYVPLSLGDLPYLPIGLFKRFDLRSIPGSHVAQILTSSGTSGSSRSRVFLDRETSILQMRALASIVTSFIGDKRLPLLVIDAPNGKQDPAGYAARAVAIKGFSLFGNGTTVFAFTETMQPDLEKVEEFVKSLRGERFLVFGFTYVVWRYLLEHLDKHDRHLDLANGVLIHGGGWKRLTNANVNDSTFKKYAKERAGLQSVYNYYGMVEQPGSIYMQCEQGYMHCSHFSDIFIRRLTDLSIAAPGESGILQTLSVLPRSYPGHNLLTEDVGVFHGEDDCGCGRRGKYFTVLGRLPTATPKGCSDTYDITV